MTAPARLALRDQLAHGIACGVIAGGAVGKCSFDDLFSIAYEYTDAFLARLAPAQQEPPCVRCGKPAMPDDTLCGPCLTVCESDEPVAPAQQEPPAEAARVDTQVLCAHPFVSLLGDGFVGCPDCGKRNADMTPEEHAPAAEVPPLPVVVAYKDSSIDVGYGMHLENPEWPPEDVLPCVLLSDALALHAYATRVAAERDALQRKLDGWHGVACDDAAEVARLTAALNEARTLLETAPHSCNDEGDCRGCAWEAARDEFLSGERAALREGK